MEGLETDFTAKFTCLEKYKIHHNFRHRNHPHRHHHHYRHYAVIVNIMYHKGSRWRPLLPMSHHLESAGSIKCVLLCPVSHLVRSNMYLCICFPLTILSSRLPVITKFLCVFLFTKFQPFHPNSEQILVCLHLIYLTIVWFLNGCLVSRSWKSPWPSG